MLQTLAGDTIIMIQCGFLNSDKGAWLMTDARWLLHMKPEEVVGPEHDCGIHK